MPLFHDTLLEINVCFFALPCSPAFPIDKVVLHTAASEIKIRGHGAAIGLERLGRVAVNLDAFYTAFIFNRSAAGGKEEA